MTALISGLINDLDKVTKTKRSQSLFIVSDCSGWSKWIFMSPTGQLLEGRLCSQEGQPDA